MSFTRARKYITNTYQIGNTSITRASSVKDLGTWYDPKLSFQEHISKVCKTSRKSLGFVLRQSRQFNDRITSCVLYNSFVRSMLECNSIVWNPIHDNHTLTVEKIQKTFIRSLYNKIYGCYPLMYPTSFILGMVEYRTLEVRRSLSLITYIFRIVRGASCNPLLLAMIGFYVPWSCTIRPHRQRLFALPVTRCKCSDSAPLPRALRLINRLLISDSSLDLFTCSEPNFIFSAGHYLESLTSPSSVQV